MGSTTTNITASVPLAEPLPWSAPDELQAWKDLMASHGALGYSEQEAIGPVDRIAETAAGNLALERTEREKHAIEEARDIYSRLSEARQLEAVSRSQLSELQQQHSKLVWEQEKANGDFREFADELRQHRVRVGVQNGPLATARRIMAEAIEADRAELQSAHEAERARFAVAQEAWNANLPEANRRAVKYEAEKAAIEEKLVPVEKQLRGLREVGITQTTSGLLSWAGYIVMAGAAYGITHIFSAHQDSADDLISIAISGIKSLIGGDIHSFSQLWNPLLHFCGLILAMLFAIAGLTIVAEYTLRKIYPRWTHRQLHRAKPGKSPLSLIADRFKESPIFKRSRERGNEDQEVEVVFNSYPQLLSWLPYIMLFAFVLFLIGALTPGGAKILFPTPYLGMAVALAMASTFVTYANFVIGPRLRETVENGESPKLAALVRWEATFLILVIVIGIVIAAMTAKTNERFDHLCWALLSIFLLLASLPFACGILQKGLFRDYLEMESRRQFYVARIDSCLRAPRMRDVSEELDRDRLDDASTLITPDKMLELEILDAIHRRYQPDLNDNRSLFDDFSRNVSGFLKGKSRVVLPQFSKDVQPETILATTVVDDHFLDRHREIRSRCHEAEANLKSLDVRLSNVQSDLNSSTREVEDLDRLRRESSLRLLELRHEFDSKQQKLQFQIEKLRAESREAYAFGKAAHDEQANRVPPTFEEQSGI